MTLSPGFSVRKPLSDSRQALLSLLGVLVIAALFLAGSGRFLPYQSLWVDETTQLSGVELGPTQLFPWLIGEGPDLGVPADRMPPGAYLAQMAWSSVAGFSEARLRWFGIACTVVGLLFTAMAARRAYGPGASVAAALFLAVSPNVLIFSVEIRAYPIFFMLSGAGSYLLVRALQTGGRSRVTWMILLSMVSTAAAFTHFFGVVLAGAMFLALVVGAWHDRKSYAPIAACGAAVGLACAALTPFVLSAIRVSTSAVSEVGEVADSRFIGIARLIYRLYAHPAMARSVAVTAVASVGFGAAMLVAVLVPRRLEAVRAGILAALLSGLGVVAGASFLVGLFGTASPHYNIWALPLVALLLSRTVSMQPMTARRVGTSALVLVLMGGVYATAQIQVHPDAYAHGPQRRLLKLLSDLGPQKVAVVHDEGSDAVGQILFPIRYTFGRRLPQYRYEVAPSRIVDCDSAHPQLAISNWPLAVVIRAQHARAAALAGLIDEPSSVAHRSAAGELLEKQGWRLISCIRLVGMVTADVEVLGRSP